MIRNFETVWDTEIEHFTEKLMKLACETQCDMGCSTGWPEVCRKERRELAIELIKFILVTKRREE